MKSIERFQKFVADVSRLCDQGLPEPLTINTAVRLMTELVAADDWLPQPFDQPHPVHYQQYLLYADPQERFSVVSFVWGPGQKTPIHDHTVWGVIGMLRGAEISQPYVIGEEGAGISAGGSARRLNPGDVEWLSSKVGDIHRVSNAYSDRVSISIHLYGGNIGRINRSVFDPITATRKRFMSGYANAMVPNLWSA
jgi:predicted metal-dependent enzyme (double-stranded beta helix superfamily)